MSIPSRRRRVFCHGFVESAINIDEYKAVKVTGLRDIISGVSPSSYFRFVSRHCNLDTPRSRVERHHHFRSPPLTMLPIRQSTLQLTPRFPSKNFSDAVLGLGLGVGREDTSDQSPRTTRRILMLSDNRVHPRDKPWSALVVGDIDEIRFPSYR
ncbi:hypothetical protein BaRGS_00010470 [Batillaria attramentaria]|uniref:Uncharacterized protein n=1 Tax=Batillaria attramentaria TaxID=370345 RepID=A0ABD0LFQ8_9CAEN